MKRSSTIVCAAVALSVSGHAFAQGYYSGTQGARAAGRAGAFTARADDLSAVELNPAGLAGIRTTLIHVGNRFSHNRYDYTRQPTLDWGNTSNNEAPLVRFDTVHNGTPWQYLDPMFGVASNLGLRDWGFALAAYAPAGIARESYPADGGQRYMMVSRDSQFINYAASVAWKLRDVFGLGATFQWIAVPKLNYQLMINGDPQNRASGNGVHPVASPFDVHAEVSGSDMFTPNLILGAWLRPVEYLQAGLSAQVIPATIDVKGKLGVRALTSQLDNLTLLRNNRPADNVTLSLPLPIKIREGIRYRHIRGGKEIFDIELDVAYEFWSRVQTFTLETNGLEATAIGTRVPIGRIDIQKHWKNTVTVMLGGDYVAIPNALTVRGGTFYVSALSDPGYTQIDFVGGKQLGGALGLSVFAGNLELAAAYEYRHQLPVSITESESRVYQQEPAGSCKPPYTDTNTCHSEYIGVPGPSVNAGSYTANSHILALDALYRF